MAALFLLEIIGVVYIMYSSACPRLGQGCCDAITCPRIRMKIRLTATWRV